MANSQALGAGAAASRVRPEAEGVLSPALDLGPFDQAGWGLARGHRPVATLAGAKISWASGQSWRSLRGRRFHAIATPHVPRRPNPSGPVPPIVVTAHRASPRKQRKQLVFWLFFGVIAVRCE